MNAENGPAKEEMQWGLRYVVLFWISLVCMIPFDLAQFDEGDAGQTAHALVKIGKENLSRSGMEREAAALLLSRLYMRKNMSGNLSSFFDFAEQEIRNPSDLFTVRGKATRKQLVEGRMSLRRTLANRMRMKPPAR